MEYKCKTKFKSYFKNNKPTIEQVKNKLEIGKDCNLIIKYGACDRTGIISAIELEYSCIIQKSPINKATLKICIYLHKFKKIILVNQMK